MRWCALGGGGGARPRALDARLRDRRRAHLRAVRAKPRRGRRVSVQRGRSRDGRCHASPVALPARAVRARGAVGRPRTREGSRVRRLAPRGGRVGDRGGPREREDRPKGRRARRPGRLPPRRGARRQRDGDRVGDGDRDHRGDRLRPVDLPPPRGSRRRCAPSWSSGGHHPGALRSVPSSRAVPRLLVAAGPFVACACVRLAVFGRAAPLSVLAKPSDLAHGLPYAGAAAIVSLAPLVVLAPYALARAGGRPAAIALAGAAHFLVTAAVGGDWMPYARLVAADSPLASLRLRPRVTADVRASRRPSRRPRRRDRRLRPRSRRTRRPPRGSARRGAGSRRGARARRGPIESRRSTSAGRPRRATPRSSISLASPIRRSPRSLADIPRSASIPPSSSLGTPT